VVQQRVELQRLVLQRVVVERLVEQRLERKCVEQQRLVRERVELMTMMRRIISRMRKNERVRTNGTMRQLAKLPRPALALLIGVVAAGVTAVAVRLPELGSWSRVDLGGAILLAALTFAGEHLG